MHQLQQLCVVIFLAMALSSSHAVTVGPFKRFHVRIVNNISDTDTLTVRCNHGYDTVAPHQEYVIDFKINLWVNTKYVCDLSYCDPHYVYQIPSLLVFMADQFFVDKYCGHGRVCEWIVNQGGALNPVFPDVFKWWRKPWMKPGSAHNGGRIV